MTTSKAGPGVESVTRLPRLSVKTGMHDFLQRLVVKMGYPEDKNHRYIVVAHLFDDTMRMLEAMDPVVEFDAIVGIPYSSDRPGVAEKWAARFGDKVHIKSTLEDMERLVVDQLARSLALCKKNRQKLIVQEVGGFVSPLLTKYFRDHLHLVKGVVEITKQGVWRAEEQNLGFPVLHCADSELKRLEAKRCGETIVRCVDGLAREMGLSLAGRFATVIGAGWIGSGVANGLKRLDVIPAMIDRNPLKVTEARLDGFAASTSGDWLEKSHLVIGATGRNSITREMLERLPHNAIVASGSSRQLEIDVEFLKSHPSTRVTDSIEAFHIPTGHGRSDPKNILLVNDGFPANFIPGSGSVPDEIVETILGELMVLMGALAKDEFEPGIHRITPEQESICAELWLEMRDASRPETLSFDQPLLQHAVGAAD